MRGQHLNDDMKAKNVAPRTLLHNYNPFDTFSTALSSLAVYCALTCISVSCLSSCAAGEVPFNHEILREANALCHRLPVLSTIKFKTDFYDVSTLCVPSGDIFIKMSNDDAGVTLQFLIKKCHEKVETNKPLVSPSLNTFYCLWPWEKCHKKS